MTNTNIDNEMQIFLDKFFENLQSFSEKTNADVNNCISLLINVNIRFFVVLAHQKNFSVKGLEDLLKELEDLLDDVFHQTDKQTIIEYKTIREKNEKERSE